ncbi:hypothetical protein AA313_de0207109 [Arthrobotrys entomopaga]|nr:hypothetical protein AA313_de0207109 [Arthrobotrys entomopaga]
MLHYGVHLWEVDPLVLVRIDYTEYHTVGYILTLSAGSSHVCISSRLTIYFTLFLAYPGIQLSVWTHHASRQNFHPPSPTQNRWRFRQPAKGHLGFHSFEHYQLRRCSDATIVPMSSKTGRHCCRQDFRRA